MTDWIEHHGGWDDTVVILTADHGHYFMLDQPEMLVPRQSSERGSSQQHGSGSSISRSG